MSVLYIAVPVALLIAAGAVWAFIWSVKSGQLDDLETPAARMLFDDEPTTGQKKTSSVDDA
ncbi:cbb3-type cytochrome oxidase assembly protein CcoS [Calycomorphotria hydatis]|uniref:Cytochrome oxidase maturation protein cbb3-type n=1 Tax=Calycomorphotria hydatis TaxID=2528027 RepID=A0A517TDF9_9PLAN|nr:cbb3-type cytochrome oxidase assembly protein CcoS [Calycomorphotria hydatis]QDT66401.1 Cytochrome oxidase maturation protein cbb3-type [Calycomorphotria hydatis]